MQSAEPVRSGPEEDSVIAEPLPQHTDAVPLVQTTPSAPRRRQNTRQVAQRRRQRLQELLQNPASPPASP
jgi:hypothetical protein